MVSCIDLLNRLGSWTDGWVQPNQRFVQLGKAFKTVCLYPWVKWHTIVRILLSGFDLIDLYLAQQIILMINQKQISQNAPWLKIITQSLIENIRLSYWQRILKSKSTRILASNQGAAAPEIFCGGGIKRAKCVWGGNEIKKIPKWLILVIFSDWGRQVGVQSFFPIEKANAPFPPSRVATVYYGICKTVLLLSISVLEYGKKNKTAKVTGWKIKYR